MGSFRVSMLALLLPCSAALVTSQLSLAAAPPKLQPGGLYHVTLDRPPQKVQPKKNTLADKFDDQGPLKVSKQVTIRLDGTNVQVGSDQQVVKIPDGKFDWKANEVDCTLVTDDGAKWTWNYLGKAPPVMLFAPTEKKEIVFVDALTKPGVIEEAKKANQIVFVDSRTTGIHQEDKKASQSTSSNVAKQRKWQKKLLEAQQQVQKEKVQQMMQEYGPREDDKDDVLNMGFSAEAAEHHAILDGSRRNQLANKNAAAIKGEPGPGNLVAQTVENRRAQVIQNANEQPQRGGFLSRIFGLCSYEQE